MKRVFLSYTARDLAAHASVVRSVATRLGWDAVDHRNWAPNGRPSVSECMKQVDACDALIVLTASRYGWVPTREEGGDGVRSITWLEVARARSRGIAVIPLLLDDSEFDAADRHAEGTAARNALEDFRSELRKSLVRFFTTLPASVEAPVEQGLESWDGRTNDERMPWRRRVRRAAPVALASGLIAAWVLAGPVIHARLLERPRQSMPTWLQSWETVAIVLLGAAAIALWLFSANRGRPQTMYRAFPLSRFGDLAVIAVIAAAVGLCGGAAIVSVQEDPPFEAVIAGFLDGARFPGAATTLAPDRWQGAKHEADVRALRDFVLPVQDARRKLSASVALADVRETVRRLTAPSDISDSRVRLLADIASLHTTAIALDAKRAIAHYETAIEPVLPRFESVWRAEAHYAIAGWIDYWAFTNLLEPLDRTGAPKYTLAEVRGAFDKVLAEIGDGARRPSWVTCAAKTNASMVLARDCGGRVDGECASLDDKMRAAVACHESREDGHGARTAKHNFALRLLTSEKLNEAYNYFRSEFDETGDRAAGLQALGLEAIASVAPTGQTLDPSLVAQEVAKEPDRRRRGEMNACLDLLGRLRAGADVQTAHACRVAFACYLTDNPVANARFCGVPDVKVDATDAVSSQGAVFSPRLYPVRFVVRGAIKPGIPAKDVVAECDGDVEQNPSFVINLPTPASLTVRVYSRGDSVLLVRGREKSACADDAPIPGQGKSSDAGLRFDATAGRHEFFVGTYGVESLDYEARILVRAPGH